MNALVVRLDYGPITSNLGGAHLSGDLGTRLVDLRE